MQGCRETVNLCVSGGSWRCPGLSRSLACVVVNDMWSLLWRMMEKEWRMGGGWPHTNTIITGAIQSNKMKKY